MSIFRATYQSNGFFMIVYYKNRIPRFLGDGGSQQGKIPVDKVLAEQGGAPGGQRDAGAPGKALLSALGADKAP